MAFQINKSLNAQVFGLIAAHNDRQNASVASLFHSDITAITTATDYRYPTATNLTITVANATDLATSIALANECQRVLNIHWQDTYAHKTAVSPVDATPAAVDLATGQTLANALKAAFNTHLSAANVHWTNDGTNTVATANATDQTTLNALLNAIKSAYNAHVVSAPAGRKIQLLGGL